MDTFVGIGSFVLLFVLGLVMMIKPEFLWKIEHFFTVDYGEPSDFYLTKLRIGGVLFTLICIFVFLYIIFFNK